MRLEVWWLWLCLYSLSPTRGTTRSSHGSRDGHDGSQLLMDETLRLFLDSSPATHSYIIHDGDYDLLGGTIEETMARHSVTLVKYDGFDLLRAMFTDVSFDQGGSNVVLLCSSKAVLDILRQVTLNYLESVLRFWFIFIQNSIKASITKTIREGMQITVVEVMNGTGVDIYSSRPTIDNGMRFELIGRGTLRSKRQPDIHQSPVSIKVFHLPLVPPLLEIYSDFQGRELIVAANNDWPFFGQIYLPNGTVLPDNGIDVSLVNVLGEKYNFTYKVIPPSDGQWGGPQPDGSVSGMIGMVARREAHLAIDEITITDTRETVIDFSMPYLMDATFILSPSPKPLSRALAILSPFTYEVWGTLALTLFTIGPILVAIDAVEKGRGSKNRWTVSETLFNTFRSLVIQGNKLKTTRSAPRVLLAIWFIFCVVVYALYGSTLTAILAVPSYEKPIDSILDVVDVTESGEFAIGTIKETSLELLFKEATFGSYKIIWQRMRPEDMVTSIKSGFDKVMTSKFIYIISGITTKVHTIEYGEWHFHIAKEYLFPQTYGIACPRGAPYIPAFNQVIMHLKEAGIIDMWVQHELQKGQMKSWKAHSQSQFEAQSREPGALTLDHLQGAFFMAGIGVFLAGIVLMVEIAAHKFNLFKA